MFLIILRNIKVLREDFSGKKVPLYFFVFDNNCKMKISIYMANTLSKIMAFCSANIKFIIIPIEFIDSYFSKLFKIV